MIKFFEDVTDSINLDKIKTFVYDVWEDTTKPIGEKKNVEPPPPPSHLLNKKTSKKHTSNRKLPAPPKIKKSGTGIKCMSIAPYKGRAKGELSFNKNEIFIIKKKRKDGWYDVTRSNGSKRGLIPSNYVQMINTNVVIPPKIIFSKIFQEKFRFSRPIGRVQALYSYKKKKKEELSFRKGEVQIVFKKRKDGWFVARNESGQWGLIPGNYIRFLRDKNTIVQKKKEEDRKKMIEQLNQRKIMLRNERKKKLFLDLEEKKKKIKIQKEKEREREKIKKIQIQKVERERKKKVERERERERKNSIQQEQKKKIVVLPPPPPKGVVRKTPIPKNVIPSQQRTPNPNPKPKPTPTPTPKTIKIIKPKQNFIKNTKVQKSINVNPIHTHLPPKHNPKMIVTKNKRRGNVGSNNNISCFNPNLTRSSHGVVSKIGGFKGKMLSWVRKWVQNYNVEIFNLHKSFKDGIAFCAIVHKFNPNAFNFSTLCPSNARKNLELAFNTAQKYGIPRLLDPEDIIDFERPDDVIISTYLSEVYKYYQKGKWKTNQGSQDIKVRTTPGGLKRSSGGSSNSNIRNNKAVKKSGKGVMYYDTGEKLFEGEMKNGKRVKGIQYWKDGSKQYSGEFSPSNGEFHGHGDYFYPSGETYKGQWMNGKKEGHGEYVYIRSEFLKYVGGWKANEKDGEATLYYNHKYSPYAKGSYIKTLWKKNQLVKIKSCVFK